MKINRSLAWMAGAFAAIALIAAMGVSMKASADNGNEGGDNGNGNSVSAAVHAAITSSVSNGDGSNSSDNGNGQGQGEGEQGASSMQESLAVTPSGNFKITGAQVVAVNVNAQTITATLYGITKTVSVAGASITGGNASMGLADIKAGDVLSATGNYNESTQVAAVSTVNDVSAGQANTSAIQAKIAALVKMVQQLQAQLQSMSQTGTGNGSNASSSNNGSGSSDN